MQLDFHYYGTYCAAILAGWSHEDSLKICYSAQFVDCCSKALLAKIRGPVSAATTQLQVELMDQHTDLPGMQLYTANYLDEEPGKDGAVYKKRSAVCFETQFWPDTVNKENFPGGVLTEGEEFTSRTTYKFSITEE